VRSLGFKRLLHRVALITIVLLMFSGQALPQGCALCYTQAASSGARLIRALRNGIVILIIPPLSMCTAAIFFAYRKRNQFNEDVTPTSGVSDW